jgi:hypothetical protein
LVVDIVAEQPTKPRQLVDPARMSICDDPRETRHHQQPWKPMQIRVETGTPASAASQQQQQQQQQGEEDNVGRTELHHDVFTLFFLSEPLSQPFNFALFVILTQYTIYGLLLWTLIDDDDPYRDRNNVLKVPPYVDHGGMVDVAQFMALLIAVITQDDIMLTIELITVGYDPALLISHPSATLAYWTTSCLARFVEGAVGVVVACIFILQSSTVIDIFLNFAAVQFVANLDNVGFALADAGLIGRAAQVAAHDAKYVQLPFRQRKYRKLRQLAVFFSFAIMVCIVAWLQRKQSQGDYILGTSCRRLQISLPEEFVALTYPLDVTDTQ